MRDLPPSSAPGPTRPAAATLSGLLSGLLLVACSATAAPPPPAGADEAGALLRRIESTIGRARCSSDAQCRTLAVGHKPCGGPEAYLAWSSSVTEGAGLEALARAHAEARRREHEASGRMSNCSLLADPGAVCRAGRCELREAAPAGDAPR